MKDRSRRRADRAPGRPRRPWPRRWVVLLLALGVASALGSLAIVGYRAAPRIVTGIAFRRARELAAEISRQAPPPGEELFAFRLFGSAPPFQKKLDEASGSLAADFGGLFRAGYFEPAVAIGELPREGFSPGALPFFVLCGAYAHAIEGKVGTSREAVAGEAARWVSAVCRSAGAKECIVHILVRDLEPVPGRREPGGFFKLALMTALTCRDPDDYGWAPIAAPSSTSS